MLTRRQPRVSREIGQGCEAVHRAVPSGLRHSPATPALRKAARGETERRGTDPFGRVTQHSSHPSSGPLPGGHQALDGGGKDSDGRIPATPATPHPTTFRPVCPLLSQSRPGDASVSFCSASRNTTKADRSPLSTS